jgi:hypothetical protein
MRRIEIAGLCLIATLALSAVVSASASAKNPRWVICEVSKETRGQWEDALCAKHKTNSTHETKELKANETREIKAEADGLQKLGSPSLKLTILCKKLKVKAGAILIGGEPGTDTETLVYEECEVEAKPKCRINDIEGGKAIIATTPLASTLGYKTQKQEEEENQTDTVTVFKAEAHGALYELEIAGEKEAECTSKALEKVKLPVSGEFACENVSAGTHLVTHELNCPEPRIAEYWRQTAEQKPEKVVVKKLEIAGFEWTVVSKTAIKLTSGQGWWIV